MQALLPILLSANENSTKMSDDSTTSQEEEERLSALEAKAVAEATATADRSFVPSPAILNSNSPSDLLKQVDGPSLIDYKETESVFVGSSVPIAAGGSLTVPIQVNTPGSIVEYAAENKAHDIGFGITAEREEGVTIVQVSFMKATTAHFGKNQALLTVPNFLVDVLCRKWLDAMLVIFPCSESFLLEQSHVCCNSNLITSIPGCVKRLSVTRLPSLLLPKMF